jgi:hypothetical protein
VHFGYREYDPDVGRFITKDPIGYAGGDSDLYGYCLDDPVNLHDRSGLFPGVRGIVDAYQAIGVLGAQNKRIPIPKDERCKEQYEECMDRARSIDWEPMRKQEIAICKEAYRICKGG